MKAAVPALLLAYRRADLLARVLQSIRANNIPRLYIFSDAPADDTVAREVQEVRQLIYKIDWTETTIVERTVNRGVDDAFVRSISEVLEVHEEVIVLEDDLEFTPGTYEFLCAAMERYRDEPRVMCIGAWASTDVTPPGVTQPYFSRRANTWVFGIWRRAWKGFPEMNGIELRDLCLARGIDPACCGSDVPAGATRNNGNGPYDYRFNLHMLLHDGLNLYPARSMVSHIGYDERSSHYTASSNKWRDTASPAPAISDIDWPSVTEHPMSAELWRRKMMSRSSLLQRVGRSIFSFARF